VTCLTKLDKGGLSLEVKEAGASTRDERSNHIKRELVARESWEVKESADIRKVTSIAYLGISCKCQG